MNEVIIMDNVTKQFSGVATLKSVSLNIVEGEIFGLLGPSGAGKTTIIRILTGQIPLTSGNATIFERNVSRLSDEEYSKIGMVLDNSGLYERLSTYDNLKIFAKIFKVNEGNINAVLNEVGLLDVAKRKVSALSKGMIQRLILARAILHKPSLLFLDEPTSGLDPTTSEKIHKLLFNISSQGTTIFLTTHDMEEATKMCTHVALLNEGRIIEYGSPDDICKKYNEKQEIVIECADASIIRLKNNKTNARRIADLFENEIVVTIHSSEPTLETVFINLTGRSLK
ncbi:MAG TPA: ABC transporter ATP-binding protein [Clostridiaceae bacterium]|nr:ABC transporter ATP-binding protein [Clostridiaceae bacterium]